MGRWPARPARFDGPPVSVDAARTDDANRVTFQFSQPATGIVGLSGTTLHLTGGTPSPSAFLSAAIDAGNVVVTLFGGIASPTDYLFDSPHSVQFGNNGQISNGTLSGPVTAE